MNKFIKTIILAVVTIAVVSAVLVFIQTILAPPEGMASVNQYQQSLSQGVDAYKGITTPYEGYGRGCDSLTNLAHLMWKEKLIDNKTYDKANTGIISGFAPLFASESLNYFNGSSWDRGHLSSMQQRIASLRGMTTTDEKKILNNKKVDTQFNNILSIIGLYDEALGVASRGFSGMDAARNSIARARELRGNQYLSRNTSLMAMLRELPGRLEASHFASVRAKVNALAGYKKYSDSTFDSMVDRALAAIEEYRNNAEKIYGTSHGVGDLLNSVNNYEVAARDYYQMKAFEEEAWDMGEI